MTKRRKLTPKQKATIREEQGGMCFLCHEPLDLSPDDPTEFDHIIARGYGGSEDLENFCALHRACHRAPGAKTAKDQKVIAKVKRIRKKLDPDAPPKRKHAWPKREMQGRPFDKSLTRKFNGQTVRREP